MSENLTMSKLDEIIERATKEPVDRAIDELLRSRAATIEAFLRGIGARAETHVLVEQRSADGLTTQWFVERREEYRETMSEITEEC